jgi:hypothetical protein
MIDLSQEELKILVSIMDSVNFKLIDAPKVLPLRQKLYDAVVPEKVETVAPAKPDNTIKS